MTKIEKKCPFSRWIKRKKGRLYGVLGPPKEGDLDPKIDDFGHFWPFLAKKQPDQAKFWLGRTPKKGSKSAVLGPFFHFPGGVPGFWQKRALNNGNLSGTFSGFAGKRALKIDFWGGVPPKLSHFRSFIRKMTVKWFCHQTSIKRLHLRHIDIFMLNVCLRNAMDSGG